MPDISDSDYRNFVNYQTIGSPEEVRAKIRRLEKDNRKFRRELSEATGKVPGEGMAVVPKEDADLIPKIKELGDPKDLKTRLEKGEKAVKDLSTLQKRTSALAFAKAVSLAEESVDTMLAIPDLAEASFSTEKGKVRNKDGVEVDGHLGFITVGDKKYSFADAQEQFPALKGLKMMTPSDAQQGGRDFVQQSGGSDGGSHSGDVFSRIRESRKAENNDGQQKNLAEQRLGMLTG